MIDLDIQFNDDVWDKEQAENIAKASAAAVALSDIQGVRPGDVSILFTSDSEVQTLNRDWRDKNKPTNVLSFPAPPMPAIDGVALPLGDIAIAHGVCVREAAEKDIPFAHHLSHLIVHGLLHLYGYDHMNDDEAGEMEGHERAILNQMGIPDPYFVAL
ncbi:MAG: rRNA maturation RNase YbeY [Pseudomonadota bacterium]